MSDQIGGLIIILVFYLPIILWITKKVKKRKEQKEQEYKRRKAELDNKIWTELNQRIENAKTPGEQEQTTTSQEQERDWTKCYQRTHLLTKNEYHEYKKLKHYADRNNLIICPKVRLLDIIVPREGYNNLAALGKISSKHIDFLICDQNLYIKGIIELDDNSHKLPERIERDKFVDSILTSVGYKVVHTYSVTEETLSCFIDKKEGMTSTVPSPE